MIRIIKSGDRHHANFGWLDTRWHFSFDSYFDPENINWGALRVFNDDVVQPGEGFGMHGHRDMEIITVVLDGELEHRDSQGNRGVIRPGEVQVMSAGTGIRHSESNPAADKPVHFLQVWVVPRTMGLKPRWEQRQFDPAQGDGKLQAVVSGGEIPGTLRIDQDAQVYRARPKAGERVTHQTRPGRKAYLFVIAGRVDVNGRALAAGDQARIADEKEVTILTSDDSDLLLLDLPEVNEE